MNRIDRLFRGSDFKSSWDSIFLRNLAFEPDDVAIKESYRKSDLVFICVSTTARAISQVPLKIMRKMSNGTWQWVGDRDPVQQLLSKPNVLTDSPEEFLSAIISHLLLDGHVFIVPYPPTGKYFDSLWVVKRENMDVNTDNRTGQINFWLYKPNNTLSVPILPNEIGSIKFFNPYDPIWGFAPLEAGKLPITSDFKASSYSNRFWDQGAVPGGVLQSEKNLTDERMERIRKQFLSEHEGYKKSHRIAVLEGGLKYQQVGLSQKDMDFLNLRKYNRDTILQIFGMKKAVISVVEDLNYATAKEERKEWWQDTNLPLMKLIEGSLSNILYPNNPDIKIVFDISGVESLHEDYTKRVEIGETLMKIGFTANEINERLELGFKPKAWRDKWYMPVNMLPVTEAGIERPPTPPQNTPSLPYPPGQTPPQLPEPRFLAKEVEQLEEIKEINEVQAADYQQTWKGVVSKSEPLELELLSKIRRCFFDMRKKALRLLNQKSIKDLLDETFNEDKDHLMKWTVPIYERAARTGAQTMAKELGMGMSFEINNPEVIHHLLSRPIQLKGVVDTVMKQCRDDVSQGMAQNETINQIAARIKNNFANASNRAMTIARTEVGSSINFGRNKEIEASGYSRRIWVTAGDEHVRLSHVHADGQIVEVGKPFLVGGASLRYPGDPLGPGFEVINCRCIEVIDETSRGSAVLKETELLRADGQLFDISQYPTDFKQVTAAEQAKQANLKDIAGLINRDIEQIKTLYIDLKNVAVEEGFSPSNLKIIQENMTSQFVQASHYLAEDTKGLMDSYIQRYVKLASKLPEFGVTDIDTVNRLGIDSVRKLLMQEVESNRQQFTDHGIRHLIGNIDRQSKLLDVLAEQGGPITDFDRFKAQFIMINHDVGYTTPLVRDGGLRGVKASGQHKVYSTRILEEQKELWDIGKIFSDADYKNILQTVLTHDSTDLSLADPVAFATRIADNTSLYAKEKLPSMLKYVDGGEQILIDMHHAMLDENEIALSSLKDKLRKQIDDSKLSEQLKRDLKSGVSQISVITPKYTSGVLGGDLTEIYSSSKSFIVMDVEHNSWDTYLTKFFDMGQKQMKKLMDDYGAKFEDNILTIGKRGDKNLIEIRILKSPVPNTHPLVKDYLEGITRKSELVQNYAGKYGLDESVAESIIKTKVQDFIDRQDIWVRRGPAGFEGFLRDGRMKTQFETGRSGGTFGPHARQTLEKIIVGINPEEPLNRPVYGYMSSDVAGGLGRAGKSVNQYGDRFAFKLKPRTKSFSTVTWGDSLDTNFYGLRNIDSHMSDHLLQGLIPPGKDAKWLGDHIFGALSSVSSPVEDIDLKRMFFRITGNPEELAYSKPQQLIKAIWEGNIKKFEDSIGFIESQIHGGVTAQDVQEIWFKTQKDYLKYKDQVEALGIKARSAVIEKQVSKTKEAYEKIFSEVNWKSMTTTEARKAEGFIDNYLTTTLKTNIESSLKSGGFYEGYKYKVSSTITKESMGRTTVFIKHILKNPSTDTFDLGTTKFTFYKEAGHYLYHDFYKFDKEFQRLGISKKVMGMSERIASEKFDMTIERLTPAWSGIYVWPGKFGYVLDTHPIERQRIIDKVADFGRAKGIEIKSEADFIKLKEWWDTGSIDVHIPGYKREIPLTGGTK